MQKRHVWWTSLLLGTGVVPVAVAQGIPAGAVNAATTAAPAVAAAAPQQTLWSWLGCSWEQKEECRRMLCKLPLGQLLNNASAPLGLMTGGIIPSFCPQTPSAEQLKDQGAVGAAAAIKADEAAAKERRAAVRYLGTVDCHYWPEAQDALIASLRGDRNECVRFEAALALGNGCCCTKKTIEALMNATTCSNRDDFPRETSARVQAAARQALEKCLCCFEDMTPAPAKKDPSPEKSKGEKNQANPEKSGETNQKISTSEPRKLGEAMPRERPTKMAYYARINEQPMELIVREGRRVLSVTQPMPVSGSNSFAKLLDRASGVPETRGYIVHGGQPGQAELVAAKPTNLWEMMTGRNQPVVVSSYPARSTVVPQAETARVVPEPVNVPTMKPAPVPMSTAEAAGSITTPTTKSSMTSVMQPPPVMPAMKTAPLPTVELPTTPTPRVNVPVAAPTVPAVKVSEAKVAPTMQKTAPSIQTVQATTPPTPASAQPKAPVVTKATAPVSSPAVHAPAKPAVDPMQNLMQKISMGNVQERTTALESLSAVHKASPELCQQLIKTAEQDKNEQVRCAAIRAMVRTGVPAGQAIPVLANLGMDLESKVGKEANQALAQINLQLTK